MKSVVKILFLKAEGLHSELLRSGCCDWLLLRPWGSHTTGPSGEALPTP